MTTTPPISELEEVVVETEIKCCSGTFTKKSLDYNVKISFLSILMLFSMTGIVYIELFGDKCSNLTPILTGILTGIMGMFIPTPKRKT